ncbi:hypothetical protein ACOSQ4_030485 [Xanthoceras sorbifolium]
MFCYGWTMCGALLRSYEEAARLGCSSTFCRASKRAAAAAYVGMDARTPLSSCKLDKTDKTKQILAPDLSTDNKAAAATLAFPDHKKWSKIVSTQSKDLSKFVQTTKLIKDSLYLMRSISTEACFKLFGQYNLGRCCHCLLFMETKLLQFWSLLCCRIMRRLQGPVVVPHSVLLVKELLLQITYLQDELSHDWQLEVSTPSKGLSKFVQTTKLIKDSLYLMRRFIIIQHGTGKTRLVLYRIVCLPALSR